MDFFKHQEQAKSRTVFLIFLYACGLLALIAAAATPVVLMSIADAEPPDPAILIGICGIITLIVIGGSLVKMTAIAAGGGKMIAESLGGRPVSPSAAAPADRRLYNVVEEMALAAGIPVPAVYILDNEPSINAFAAGFSPNAAVIGVNRGTVDLLTRDELQGVIAHEFSHILNGDMRMNLRLIGLLFGLQILALVGYYAMRMSPYLAGGRRNDKGAGAGLAAVLLCGGLGLMVIGYLGSFFSAIIQAAVSRQREFLADASAVQFTRNPDGIAGALKKIGCPAAGSKIRSPHAAETSHLFFGNACGLFSLGNLLATHPDLTARIRRIDPHFNGQFPQSLQPVPAFMETKSPPKPSVPFTKESVFGRIGVLNTDNVAAAAAMLNQVPQNLLESAREPLTAQAVFLAMLLDDEAAVRQRQLAAVRQPYLLQETVRLAPQIKPLPDGEKIALAQRVSSAMKSMTAAQYKQFSVMIDTFIAADQKMSLFEYTLKAVLLRDLDIYFGLARQLSVRYTSLPAVRLHAVQVLSYLAYSGHPTLEESCSAFAAAAGELGLTDGILPIAETTLLRFDQSLRTLAETSPALKKQILSALMVCVRYDGQITPKESELIRAVSAMLAVPMPM